jgi:hypothetical protein
VMFPSQLLNDHVYLHHPDSLLRCILTSSYKLPIKGTGSKSLYIFLFVVA